MTTTAHSNDPTAVPLGLRRSSPDDRARGRTNARAATWIVAAGALAVSAGLVGGFAAGMSTPTQTGGTPAATGSGAVQTTNATTSSAPGAAQPVSQPVTHSGAS